jgi:hypothetical protein
MQVGGVLSGLPPLPIPARQKVRGGACRWVRRRRAAGFDGEGDVLVLPERK